MIIDRYDKSIVQITRYNNDYIFRYNNGNIQIFNLKSVIRLMEMYYSVLTKKDKLELL